MRESLDQKAWRLYTTRAVFITFHTSLSVEGIVTGYHGIYEVTIDPAGEWCTCPAHIPRCSHVLALDTADALAA